MGKKYLGDSLLPNFRAPSDHFPIAAILSYVPNNKKFHLRSRRTRSNNNENSWCTRRKNCIKCGMTKIAAENDEKEGDVCSSCTKDHEQLLEANAQVRWEDTDTWIVNKENNLIAGPDNFTALITKSFKKLCRRRKKKLSRDNGQIFVKFNGSFGTNPNHYFDIRDKDTFATNFKKFLEHIIADGHLDSNTLKDKKKQIKNIIDNRIPLKYTVLPAFNTAAEQEAARVWRKGDVTVGKRKKSSHRQHPEMRDALTPN